jgi:hypothetical protein
MGSQDIKRSVLDRIKVLTEKPTKVGAWDAQDVEELIAGTESLMILAYGERSSKLQVLRGVIAEYRKLGFVRRDLGFLRNSTTVCRAALETLKSDIEMGHITTLDRRLTGEITGEFNALAKQALTQNYLPVAAVLASAALEDALKRLARLNGLDVDAADMPKVISALKAKTLLSGAEIPTVQGYTRLRNNAMHAQFGELKEAEVSSLIAFLESFLVRSFS